ncbi:OmpA family protein [Croceimicrobium hydrocarbonivorans]|uniref:OmpA-like domain-containing protein n=1 Tax=Croceimicrobium hydrocarbonivorans TaxID=2761580 RepID=A0A7H0VCK8_9FLAO|nr:hypothetical protein [Croceimicrobium hydrocarbonivorans]QNR23456.1 hypothetical protein H4K34_13865 [Croceimicrobium hydrocarbonivorans]
MRPYFYLCLFLSLGLSALAQKTEIRKSYFFEVNETELQATQIQSLQKLLDSLPNERVLGFALNAYCDGPGSKAHNEALGKNRILSLQNEIQKQFADSSIKHQNFADEGQPDNLYKNSQRRVDLIIQLAPEPDYGPGIAELLKQLCPPPQVFEIDPLKDTILKAKGGSILHIPAKAFSNLRPKEKVRIEFTEVITKSEMLLNNLSTSSNGRMLESGGMFKVEAFQGQRKLKLRKRRDVTFYIPSERSIPGALVFNGNQHDSLANINWTRTNGSTLQSTSMNDFLWCCSLGRNPQPCNFWCRMGSLFGFNKDNAAARSSRSRGGENPCGAFTHFLEKYGVENVDALMLAINSNRQGEAPIKTYEELYSYLRNEERKEMEADIAKGSISSSDLNYYIFNNAQLGWINIDAFSNWQASKLTTLNIPLKPANHVDVKMVFKNRNSILPPNTYRRGNFYYKDIPKGEPVNIIATKYVNGKSFIAVQDYIIGEELGELQFEEVSLEGIKEILAGLNS